MREDEAACRLGDVLQFCFSTGHAFPVNPLASHISGCSTGGDHVEKKGRKPMANSLESRSQDSRHSLDSRLWIQTHVRTCHLHAIDVCSKTKVSVLIFVSL